MQTYINTNHFKKQLIFNTLFISALILIIWFASIFFSLSYTEKQFNKEMNTRANDISRKLEETISTLQSVSLQASLFNWTDEYTENFNGIASTNHINLNKNISELVALKALSPIIKHVSLVFPKAQIVISDYGISTLDDFWMQTFSKEVNPSSPYITNRNPSTYHLISNLPNQGNTSLFIKPISIERKESIFIFLDTNRLIYELYKASGMDNVLLHIYDSGKNEVITNTTQTITYQQAQDIAKERNSLVFNSSTASGLTVEFIVSKDMMQNELSKNVLIVSLVMFLLEILSIPASYMLSTRNYKPVKQMMDAANRSDFQDALDTIKQSFNSSPLTQEEMDIYTPLLTSALFNQLRNPNVNVETILSSLSSLGTNLSGDHIRLIAFSSLDGQKKLEQYTKDFYLLDYADNKFLVNGKKEELLDIEKHFREDEENNIYISFSEIHPISESNKAFTEIDKVIKYRNTEEDCYVISSDEIPTEMHNLDFASLKTLELAIKAGKVKEARASVENFFFDNIISIMTITSLLSIHSKLVQMFSKIVNDNALSLSTLEELKAWDINESDSISKLMEKTNEITMNIIREMKQVKDEKDQKELDEILEYLNQHIQDPSISLSILAERFSVSESTISRIIRQLTGEGFLDYINNARIEKACEMLNESEMNINSIALSVGYTNDITFRRLFKKKLGVSPTEYRNCNA